MNLEPAGGGMLVEQTVHDSGKSIPLLFTRFTSPDNYMPINVTDISEKCPFVKRTPVTPGPIYSYRSDT